MNKRWWKEGVAYQIYPRSFKDSNNDGIGDIQGIISKLDYLRNLGIDIIWISPVYQSPNEDNGYDISNYKAIMREFGTMDDFDMLLKETHKRDMKLIMDLVVNHTSDEHPWFIESRSSKHNPYRDYYIWKPGKNDAEPNNWASIFEGSVWEYDKKTKEYYMHIFSRKQPDLNWENSDVRHELYDIINWWLNKGIDGFRVDAITHIKKKPGLPNLPNPKNKKYVSSFAGHLNRPGIQTFLQELKNQTFAHYDIMTVGEANGVSADEALEWVNERNSIFNMIFQFEHLELWGRGSADKLDIHGLKETFTKWQTKLHGHGWNALFMENHDQPRSVSTWGNDTTYRKESAKSLATMFFLMQGTPFIYQGQEIGMTNVHFPSIHDYNDISAKNLYKQKQAEGIPHQDIMQIIWRNGRDNTRTPMQWNRQKNAGFSENVPWMEVNPNYLYINVEEAKEDPNSIYHYYRKLIKLRKSSDTLIYGEYKLILEGHNYVYAYTRVLNDETFLIIANLFKQDTAIALPQSFYHKVNELLLSNYHVTERHLSHEIALKPYEARVYKIKENK